MTKDELIAFERKVADAFNAAKIRAPVHLSGGNEDALIELFKQVEPTDWVLTTWRSHYHCLLHGVPPDRLMDDILAGRSITLCYPAYRILSSAIVGGILPIALGLAWAAKRRGAKTMVWAFIGDMAATTGIRHEVLTYAYLNDLPLRIVTESNGLSVATPTDKVWGQNPPADALKNTLNYSYKLAWPHAGAGERVNF